jgi:Ser/Thr protein kinase RdoA (MazF antagonist)
LVNDVYKVVGPDEAYVFKLYKRGSEVGWEAEFAEHLSEVGLEVPRMVPMKDGSAVGVLETAEGGREFMLLTFVSGRKPQPPFDGEIFRSYGELVAAFHDAADGFSSSQPRRPADLRHQLDEPLAQILPLLDPGDAKLIGDLADAVRKKIAQLSGDLSRGVCHGDVSLDNILIGPDGLTIHDFDLSAEGYRAADFTGAASTPNWESFKAGYTAKRPIPAADLEAIPWLAVVGSISNLRFHLVDKALIRGTESVHEGWADGELDGLREAAAGLL